MNLYIKKRKRSISQACRSYPALFMLILGVSKGKIYLERPSRCKLHNHMPFKSHYIHCMNFHVYTPTCKFGSRFILTSSENGNCGLY